MRVLDLDTRIAPFGDRVVDLPLLDLDLDRFRRREAEQVAAERLTFADYALATAPLLRAFLEAAGGFSRLALPNRAPWSLLTPVSSVEQTEDLLLFDIFADAPNEELLTLRRNATPAVVDLAPRTRRRELPRVGPPPHHLDLPADGVLAAHLEHWVHLLWVGPLLVPALALHRPGKRYRRRGAGFDSFLGEDADIHHRAFLEGAVIGEGAQVGADSTVRHSYVGPRSALADFTKVTCSVLGTETHTLADASFSSVVSLGEGTLANLLLRDTLLGKKVFLTSGVIFWNEAIHRTVRVSRNGELIDTRRKNLGGCAGHGCVLGARTIVAPGRALPNRTTVVMRKEEGVRRIDDLEGAPSCWFDGALVPVERVMPGYEPEEVKE